MILSNSFYHKIVLSNINLFVIAMVCDGLAAKTSDWRLKELGSNF